MNIPALGIEEAVSLSKKEGWSRVKDALEARVQQVDPKVGAYLKADPLKPLSEPDKSRPYYGLPISLKDNMCVRDWETTCASEILLNYIPPYNATGLEIEYGKLPIKMPPSGSSCLRESSFINSRMSF